MYVLSLFHTNRFSSWTSKTRVVCQIFDFNRTFVSISTKSLLSSVISVCIRGAVLSTKLPVSGVSWNYSLQFSIINRIWCPICLFESDWFVFEFNKCDVRRNYNSIMARDEYIVIFNHYHGRTQLKKFDVHISRQISKFTFLLACEQMPCSQISWYVRCMA